MEIIPEGQEDYYSTELTMSNKNNRKITIPHQHISSLGYIIIFMNGYYFEGSAFDIIVSNRGQDVIMINKQTRKATYMGPLKNFPFLLKDILNENDYHEYLKAQFEII